MWRVLTYEVWNIYVGIVMSRKKPMLYHVDLTHGSSHYIVLMPYQRQWSRYPMCVSGRGPSTL